MARRGQPVSAPDSPERKTAVSLDDLEEALGYRFRDRSLLEHALQHSSYAHDLPGAKSNERLEFLGDSVLGLVVAHSLFRAKPEWDEGQLTRAMHALVEGRSLAELARELEVGPALRLGRTEELSRGEQKKSILADAMEAIIGALYLDGGLEVVRSFIDRVFADSLASDSPAVARDPKTALQEDVMATEGEFPTYRMIRDSEVEGDDERFEVEVRLRGKPLARGVGRTKRAAERVAAKQALREGVTESDAPGPGS